MCSGEWPLLDAKASWYCQVGNGKHSSGKNGASESTFLGLPEFQWQQATELEVQLATQLASKCALSSVGIARIWLSLETRSSSDYSNLDH